MNKMISIIITAFAVCLSVFLYERFAYLHVTVKFDDLEPFEKQMNVYYKGFKIGKTSKIYPDKNYESTYIKLKLQPRNIKLPSNIAAVIKRTPSKEYINIVYPSSPSITLLKDDTVIKGKPAKDIKNLLNESFEEDDIDLIINDAANLMESANVTVQNLGITFAKINQLLEDINSDIKRASTEIAKTAENIESVTNKLDIAVDEKGAKNTIENIEQTSENIKNITEKLDKETIPTVNSVFCETNSTMENASEITSDIKTTLKKRMGLFRLMFGKPDKCN